MFPNPAWPYLRLFDDDQRIIGMDEAVATALSGDTYADKVKAIFGTSLIDYRRLNEGSGTSALDSSPKAHAAGTISGATWTASAGFDGGPALLFDGVNDYTDIYSAGLNTDLNPALFTLVIWYRMANVGVWTDATNRWMSELAADANNEIRVLKTSTNNQLQFLYTAGTTIKAVSFTPPSLDTNWHCMIMTVNKGGDALIGYHDGIKQGATVSGLGIWAGALASNQSVIGADINNGFGSFSGYLSNMIIANRAVTQAEAAQLAVR